LAAATVATAASDAGIDSKQLVLQPADAPTLRLERETSRYWSNAAYVRGRPQLRALVVRSRRLSGYYATYKARSAASTDTVVSGADICATASGAQALLVWIDRQLREANAARKKQGQWTGGRRANIGDAGWVRWSGARAPGEYVVVVWRQGRVFASLHASGLGLQRTLRLARLQQQRML
jgi:hypothetical protein